MFVCYGFCCIFVIFFNEKVVVLIVFCGRYFSENVKNQGFGRLNLLFCVRFIFPFCRSCTLGAFLTLMRRGWPRLCRSYATNHRSGSRRRTQSASSTEEHHVSLQSTTNVIIPPTPPPHRYKVHHPPKNIMLVYNQQRTSSSPPHPPTPSLQSASSTEEHHVS